MCGIVGAVAQRNITPILLEGLKRLEYRGYDSCGIALHADGRLQRSRSTSRVAMRLSGTGCCSSLPAPGCRTRWLSRA